MIDEFIINAILLYLTSDFSLRYVPRKCQQQFVQHCLHTGQSLFRFSKSSFQKIASCSSIYSVIALCANF